MDSLLLLVLITHSVFACGPEFRGERARLQKYLGLEWEPSGLKSTAHSHTKYIRQSTDLNCNFQNVTKCRWKNGLSDTMDFHIFKKTDNKAFPIIQVRPGPPKVHEGELMLLAGHHSKVEQNAIWYSSPILCQNNTGKLTFTYWLFDEALVEVFLLRNNDNNELEVLIEKPRIDCGPVRYNTDCHVDIPAQKEPFYLAIRAYNMANVDGSFVLIDNIRYNASLCKVDIDMGPSFIQKSLITGAKSKYIGTSSDLDCSSFDSACRWRNGGRTDVAWKSGQNLHQPGLWFNITGSFELPVGDFALLYVKQDVQGPYDLLRSDPIPCQIAGEGMLTIRYWFTKGVQVRICTTTVDFSPLECKFLPASSSPGPISIPVEGLTNEAFLLAFDVTKLNSDYDNLVAIDDLQYKATLCNELVDSWNLGGNFQTATILNVLHDRALSKSEDLNCNFDKRANECAWANSVDGEEVQMSWQIGSGPLNSDRFRRLYGTTKLPEGSFAVVKFGDSGGTASLSSEVIECLLTEAMLSFRFWTVPESFVTVCIVDPENDEDLDCQPAVGVQLPGPVVVDVPRMERPFRLRIRAFASRKASVLVDRVAFSGSICPTPINSRNEAFFSEQILRLTGDVNACRLLTCDFGARTPCLYKFPITTGSLAVFRKWKRFGLGDEDNSFLTTTLFHRAQIAVIESPQILLNSVNRVHFSYRVRENSRISPVQLFVCQNTFNVSFLDRCFPLISGPSNFWQDDYMQLLPSDTRFYLVAKLMVENAINPSIVDIERIYMTDYADNPLC